jgi:L-ascorbate metabolism protein UlaG (beta-lactamase superfamily)
MINIIYHGHSAIELSFNNHKILIDPFINGNKHSKVKHSELKADYIVLTHGHEDHFGDTIEIAKNNNATVIAINELANFIASKGIKTHGMGVGGSWKFPFGKIKYTIAHHSSSYNGEYMGDPAGVLLTLGNKTIYHAGDTSLFLDMKLIGEMNSIDHAFLPIGDNYTMGIDDAVKAAEFLNCNAVTPIHYSTFPVIESDPEEFKRKIEAIGKKCVLLPIGKNYEL